MYLDTKIEPYLIFTHFFKQYICIYVVLFANIVNCSNFQIAILTIILLSMHISYKCFSVKKYHHAKLLLNQQIIENSDGADIKFEIYNLIKNGRTHFCLRTLCSIQKV